MSDDCDCRYKIIRGFARSGRRITLKRRVYLWEAQQHCRDPESSSRTATSSAARQRTKRHGPWFDRYEVDA